jgi:Tfp pilus assembly protein PilE
MKRGLTLLEVMVVTICMAIIIGASSSAVYTAITHTAKVKASRSIYDRNALFEDRFRSILQNAILSSTATDTNSYFLGGAGVGGSTTEALSSSSSDSSQVQLTFVAYSPPVPSDLIQSTDDFTTLNNNYGPQGGLSEYSFTQTPIGNASVDQGYFLRRQTPPDGDPTQGGYQSVFDADVETVSYEFYDGTEWTPSWDSTTMQTPRLPAAVRITYRRKGDTADHLFVVRLVHSDVTPDNPVTQAAQQ